MLYHNSIKVGVEGDVKYVFGRRIPIIELPCLSWQLWKEVLQDRMQESKLAMAIPSDISARVIDEVLPAKVTQAGPGSTQYSTLAPHMADHRVGGLGGEARATTLLCPHSVN